MTIPLTPISSMVWVFIGSIIGSMGAAFLKGGAQRLGYGGNAHPRDCAVGLDFLL